MEREIRKNNICITYYKYLRACIGAVTYSSDTFMNVWLKACIDQKSEGALRDPFVSVSHIRHTFIPICAEEEQSPTSFSFLCL